jgi:Transposase IS66 family
VEVTNNACERALRRAVVQRKITNGYRAMWTAEGEAAIRRRDWKLTMPLRGPEKGQGWRSRFPSIPSLIAENACPKASAMAARYIGHP